jgi:sodium transport system permease protein
LRQDPKLQIVPATADWRQLIGDKKIRAAVQIPDHFEADLARGTAGEVTLFNYEGELRSGYAAAELERCLRQLRDAVVQQRLAARGLAPALLQPFAVRRENVSPPERVAGNRLGGMVPYFLILFCFMGAMYPAIDLTAGEKERGTMEPLLCCPVSRAEIVLGKFLTVLASALTAGFLACISLTLTLRWGRLGLGSGPTDLGLNQVDPAGVVGVVALFIPVVALFSAVMFALALWARNHREALSYVQPLMLFVFVPTMIGMLPGIDLNPRFALVPVLNLSLACREMLSGVWHWHLLALIFASTTAYAAAALAVAMRMFNREDVVFRT